MRGQKCPETEPLNMPRTAWGRWRRTRPSDPEGDDVTWSVTGANASAFTIDGGVLMFNDSPDYESGTVSYSVTVGQPLMGTSRGQNR